MLTINNHQDITKKDLTISLLFLIVVFLFFIFLSTISTYNNTNKHILYNNAANKLLLLDKKFNCFLHINNKFLTCDNINQTIKVFEKNISVLESNLESKEYKKLLGVVKKEYKNKLTTIEQFKANDIILLNSINYLSNLNQTILKSETLSKNTIKMASEIFTSILQYYLNQHTSYENIFNNINNLKNYLNNYMQDKAELEVFINHSLKDIFKIKKIIYYKKQYESIHLDKHIYNLNEFINKKYNKNVISINMIVIFLFMIIFIVLIVIVFVQKRLLKIKEDLVNFSTAIKNSYNSIIITDANHNIIYVNNTTISETGYTEEELIGSTPQIFKSKKSNDKLKQIQEILISGKTWQGEVENISKNGKIFYEKVSVMPIYKDDEITNYIAIKLNITDCIEEKNKAKYLAYHDHLTSLPNIINLDESLKHLFMHAKRNKQIVAVLFIDLDKFKNVNDTLGHDVGDELLIEAAKRLKSVLRKSDIVARVGGDEFIAILDDLQDKYAASVVARKILNLFAQPFITKDHQINITLSIGISIFPDDANNRVSLFKYADLAMYMAKNSGRNDFKYYKKELTEKVQNKIDIEEALKYALNLNELFLVYQPKYNIISKEIVGLETFSRWDCKKLGFMLPEKFIKIAEETGKIIDIGMFIFEKACVDFIDFKKNCSTLKSISINISIEQLYKKDFIAKVMNIVKKHNLYTNEIVLEITESSIMKNIDVTMKILSNLKDAGFKLSIDDFAIEYSSLSSLKRFPIDELKIDKTFINEVVNSEDGSAIIKAIVSLSKNMNYSNVAEGIETKIQEDFLMQTKCKIGQGYYFSRPRNRDDLIEFLMLKETT
jgi:diguanylate cyclase (GGDEF)-like protein/PAS domain S-box-containing protein